ncbi:hypothetical protein J3R83DRAFT_3455 [Lanmaoa asiatica]|nr:hypothetical protein J3R83DRAFT_3455 [Lanmaoa asiatica]
MSDSMSSPWIRDYFMDVAETYGAQLYNVPVSKKKRRVQLTDFLTYQENSYVWAWVSDKDHRVPVRISKDAVDQYNTTHGRRIIDSRFFLVFVSSYRPMFSPRPLGPNASGNTPVSHMSLEISHVSSIGSGGHLFGNPRDLESDENMKEWVLGLRQDGGGGNVLKLRKQQELVQNKQASPSPPPPPFSPAPAAQYQTAKAVGDVAKPKPERPQDLKRAYAKRWRIVEVDPWKFMTKPAVEERPIQTELGHPPVEPLLDTANRPESRGSLVCPASPHRTPSPTSLQRQGTPTDWSLSNRGSPVALDEANTFAVGNGIQQHDELEDLPHLPSDTEGHTTLDTAITSSLQPPTPAQRIKRSSICRSSSPPRSSPNSSARSSPRPSQQLPRSSPLPPSSSLSLLSSSLPMPTGIRKNIQRKVPHPGLPVSRPDPTKQGPAQILVPNSDTSGIGSSQSYSQSQHLSQSRQHQPRSLSHSPAFLSSLAKEFKPSDASTPREEKPVNMSRHASKMFAKSLPTHGDIEEQETTSADDKYTTEKIDANAGKQGSESNRPPAPSAPKIEVLEVGKPDTEEETDELQLTHNTTRAEVEFGAQTETQDTGDGDADVDHEDNQLSVSKAKIDSTLQSSPPRRPSHLTVASVIQHPSSDKQGTDGVPIHCSTRSSEAPGSQSSMHSLFSDSLEDERTVSPQAPILPVGRTEDKAQEKASPPHALRHDAVAWKEPSFIAKNKGKGKARAVEEPDTPNVKLGKKRRRSTQPESPVPKQAKVSAPEVRRATSGRTTTGILGHTQPQDTEASAIGKIHSSNRPSTSPMDTTETTPSSASQSTKPRLANFAVDFEKIDLGKKVPIPRLDLERDIKFMLLRTGRIRTLGEEVEKDGSVYIMR